MTFYTGRKIGFTVHFWRASEGKVKYGFDFTFDARQRQSQMHQRLAISLTLVKDVVKYAGNLEFAFDGR